MFKLIVCVGCHARPGREFSLAEAQSFTSKSQPLPNRTAERAVIAGHIANFCHVTFYTALHRL